MLRGNDQKFLIGILFKYLIMSENKRANTKPKKERNTALFTHTGLSSEPSLPRWNSSLGTAGDITETAEFPISLTSTISGQNERRKGRVSKQCVVCRKLGLERTETE